MVLLVVEEWIYGSNTKAFMGQEVRDICAEEAEDNQKRSSPAGYCTMKISL